MRIFVAGGTGVVGRRAVRHLVAAGHEVTALSRSDARDDVVRSLGASPVRVSLFDRAVLGEAVAGHDVVINLATHIPPVRAARSASAWAENNRIRTEGAANLVDAAAATGVARYIQESICFLYADGGDAWLDEDAPFIDPVPPLATAVLAAEAATQRFTASGGVGVVLRFGVFHAPDSAMTLDTLPATRYGFAPVAGRPGAYFPAVDAEDAASAVVAALAAPAGTFNVLADEPLTRRAYASDLAAELGASTLHPVPGAALRLLNRDAGYLTSSLRVSNRRFREATGWTPRHTSARTMFAEVLDAADERGRVHSSWVAAGLVFLAFAFAVPGLWAAIAPRSFYDTFPAVGGWSWVAADGPFNEHLIRDVGGLMSALAVLAVWALVTMRRPIVRLSAVATLVFGLPHLLYHAGHAGTLDAAANAGSLSSLVLEVGVAAGVLVGARARRGPNRSPADEPVPVGIVPGSSRLSA